MRTCIRQTCPKHSRSSPGRQKYIRDLPARRPYKMYDEDTRSGVTWHALSHAHASTPALPERLHSPLRDLGHGSGMAGVHSMHICEPHGALNGLNSAYDRECTRDSPKRRTRLHLLLLARCALEAQGSRPRSVRTVWGGSRAAHRHDHHQLLRGLSNEHQLLLRGSRPSREVFESILSTVR